MRKIKCFLGILAILLSALAIYLVLRSKNALVFQPKGIIAHSELDLILTNLFLMSIILVPTFIILLIVAWKYRANNHKAEYEPEKSYGWLGQIILWTLPSIIVAVMAVITWKATYKLDPYRSLDSEVKPLTIQVVALDWKWLFIYPEQGIAALNFVQFPERTPIRFELSGDGSPMNSFWIPQLSGQIYCMTGMITPLHVMADGQGVYSGKAAEINGMGYAGMTFIAKSTTQSDFDSWIKNVQQSPLQLTDNVYNALLVPSEKNAIMIYSRVEHGLFNKIVMKYSHPNTTEL